MRKLFLIRHGEPDFPAGDRLCLGRTDLPLSPLGRLQACLTAWALGEEKLTVFTGPLRRARETAAFLAESPAVLDGLTEAGMGDWDGLPFSEIRALWPEAYRRRGADLSIPPPGGETNGAVLARFAGAVGLALERAEGDVALVTHAQSMDLFQASVLGRSFAAQRKSRLSYGAYRAFLVDGERFQEAETGPGSPALCPALCRRLLEAAGAGERVRAHCEAVSAQALEIAGALPGELNLRLLENAALLHDIARAFPEHAAAGAGWLRALGYGDEAALVERHHDWSFPAVDEAAVLAMADRCVQEDRVVPLEVRFADSLKKCRTPAAREAHGRRYAAALALKETMNRMCGWELVR